MASPPPDALTRLLAELTRGRPRLTDDVDAALDVGPDRVAAFAEVPGREGLPDVLRRLRAEADEG
jgi:hypothetical protein